MKIFFTFFVLSMKLVKAQSAELLLSHAGFSYYKVLVEDVMSSANVNTACQNTDLKPLCAGPNLCEYNSEECLVTPLSSSCRNPMQSISNVLCNGKNPNDCPQTLDLFIYMNNWKSGSACGVIGTNWCAKGSDFFNKAALCAKKNENNNNNNNNSDAELLWHDDGYAYYKLKVQGAMLSSNVISACKSKNMKPVCPGRDLCQYNDGECLVTSLSTSCNNPMQGLSNELCNGKDPNECGQIYNLFNYMSDWNSDSTCGVIGTDWCVKGSNYYNKDALCAISKKTPTSSPTRSPTVAFRWDLYSSSEMCEDNNFGRDVSCDGDLDCCKQNAIVAGLSYVSWWQDKCFGSFSCNEQYAVSGVQTFKLSETGCVDNLNWRSRSGDSCKDYVKKGWCKAGTYGPNWKSEWGFFFQYANANGKDASHACCECQRSHTTISGCRSSSFDEVCRADDVLASFTCCNGIGTQCISSFNGTCFPKNVDFNKADRICKSLGDWRLCKADDFKIAGLCCETDCVLLGSESMWTRGQCIWRETAAPTPIPINLYDGTRSTSGTYVTLALFLICFTLDCIIVGYCFVTSDKF